MFFDHAYRCFAHATGGSMFSQLNASTIPSEPNGYVQISGDIGDFNLIIRYGWTCQLTCAPCFADLWSLLQCRVPSHWLAAFVCSASSSLESFASLCLERSGRFVGSIWPSCGCAHRRRRGPWPRSHVTGCYKRSIAVYTCYLCSQTCKRQKALNAQTPKLPTSKLSFQKKPSN